MRVHPGLRRLLGARASLAGGAVLCELAAAQCAQMQQPARGSGVRVRVVPAAQRPSLPQAWLLDDLAFHCPVVTSSAAMRGLEQQECAGARIPAASHFSFFPFRAGARKQQPVSDSQAAGRS